MSKRFKHLLNAIGMQFICYDDKEILMGTFADADGVAHVVEILNEQHETIRELKITLKEHQKYLEEMNEENEQLKNNIKEAYQTERTMIGKSVLKQLMETIQ